MTDEAIQQDASSSEAETQGQEPVRNDAWSKNQRKRDEIMQARVAEREADRKAAALMNDPDLTDEEYDRRVEAAEEARRAAEQAEREGDEDAEGAADDGDEGEEQVAAGEGEEAGQDGDEPEGQQAAAEPVEKDLGNGWFERDGRRLKKFKVNGQIVEIDEENYDRGYQKALAGDQRLREAAQREAALRQLEQRLYQDQQQSQQESRPPEQGAEEVRKAVNTAIESLLDGDTDAATDRLLAAIESGRGSSTPNMEQLLSQVSTRVDRTIEERERNRMLREGYESFKRDYADVMSDPDAFAFADLKVKQIEADEPYLTPGEVFAKAGQIARDRLGLRKPEGEQEQGPDQRDVRRQRKAAGIKPLPRAQGSARSTQGKEPEVDYSPKAIVQRAKASRFQHAAQARA